MAHGSHGGHRRLFEFQVPFRARQAAEPTDLQGGIGRADGNAAHLHIQVDDRVVVPNGKALDHLQSAGGPAGEGDHPAATGQIVGLGEIKQVVEFDPLRAEIQCEVRLGPALHGASELAVLVQEMLERPGGDAAPLRHEAHILALVRNNEGAVGRAGRGGDQRGADSTGRVVVAPPKRRPLGAAVRGGATIRDAARRHAGRACR